MRLPAKGAPQGSTNNRIIGRLPATKSLFEDIAQHIAQIQGPQASTQTLSLNQAEPASKKRKLEADTDWQKVQNIADVSFSLPVRKKLKLAIGRSPDQGFRAASGNEIEVSVKWSEVRHVFCLPVPEKAQAQYNFCVLYGDLEWALWTVPEIVPKEGVLEPPAPADSMDTYRSYTTSVVNGALKKYKKRIVEPTDQEFASQIVQAHRKNEKAYHVKAFRGSKDGFLFLLSNGIFWGFKKPVEFFTFDSIDSVSYTSVLTRTFNLNVTARSSPGVEPQEFEFSMLDQADFAGIDAYIKTHQLQDASMAEQRRAKKLNVNGVKGADADQDGDNEAEGELEKAAREAQDLEDEDEEDDENFDPGSEGESEGEGSESDEEAPAGSAAPQDDDDDEEEPDEEDEI